MSRVTELATLSKFHKQQYVLPYCKFKIILNSSLKTISLSHRNLLEIRVSLNFQAAHNETVTGRWLLELIKTIASDCNCLINHDWIGIVHASINMHHADISLKHNAPVIIECQGKTCENHHEWRLQSRWWQCYLMHRCVSSIKTVRIFLSIFSQKSHLLVSELCTCLWSVHHNISCTFNAAVWM